MKFRATTGMTHLKPYLLHRTVCLPATFVREPVSWSFPVAKKLLDFSARRPGDGLETGVLLSSTATPVTATGISKTADLLMSETGLKFRKEAT